MSVRTRNRSLRRLRALAIAAVFCVVVFDAVGIFVNRLTVDEAARVAAEHAAAALAGAPVPPALWAQTATTAANESLADQRGVQLVDLRVVDGQTVVTVQRAARVLLADRVRALRNEVDLAVTASAPVR